MEFCDFAPYEVFYTDWLSFEEVIALKAVEDVLERYYNSGRFYKTLAVAVGFFTSPFDFYLKLSMYWQSKGLVGQGVKRINLYSHLYDFLKEKLTEKNVAEVMKIMKTEFAMWHSTGVGTPQWYKEY